MKADAEEAEYQRQCFLLDPHHGNADPTTQENQAILHKMGAFIRVFRMNDCDWMAGETLEECEEVYLKYWSGTKDDGVTLYNPGQVSNDFIQTVPFTREDGTVVTFQEELNSLIAAGQKFPCFFASTEF